MKIKEPESCSTDFKYLVQIMYDDGTFSASLKTAHETADLINMSDCYNVSFEIYDVSSTYGQARHCTYKGWQPMCLIEVVRDDDGKVMFSLYGEDH